MKHLRRVSSTVARAEDEVSMTVYIEVLIGILTALIPVIALKEAADSPWG
jgi:hypothetical protein